MKYGRNLATILFGGCMLFSPGPADVAEDFWVAAQEGDEAKVEEFSLPSSNAAMEATTSDMIASVTLGEHLIDGERATVTTIVETSNDRLPTFEFNTILAHTDDGWLVDADATTGEMFKAVMSQSVGALREGMSSVMRGVSQGVSDGMKDMADAISDAADSIRR